MSRLTDLALKDACDSLNQTSSFQYQVKINLDSNLRSLQEEYKSIESIIDMLKATSDEDKDDKKQKQKYLEKLNKLIEGNRKRHTETYKAFEQMEQAISSLSRADRWIGAVAEEFKK